MKIGKKYISFHNEFSNFLKLFYCFLIRLERKWCGTKVSKKQPVFIIGAPRSGSTYLYQRITNRFNAVYIDNIVHIFAKNPLVGMKVSSLFFKSKAHNIFKSYFGLTHRYSMRAPSECARFWSFWFKKKLSFIGKSELEHVNLKKLKETIFLPINFYDKNFIFKNLSIALRLPLIKEIAPMSKFIWIKRNPIDIACSILKARESRMGDKNIWFSIKPKEIESIKSKDCYSQIVEQIYYIERQIARDIALFPINSIKIVHYEDLDNDENIIEDLRLFIDKEMGYRTDAHLIQRRTALSNRENEEAVTIFSSLMDKYDWENYTT